MISRQTRVLFVIGALGYPAIELLWRKRTHYSMALAGGICLPILYRIHTGKRGFFARCMLGAAAITAVEFVTGVIFNRVFHCGVWDYSKQKGNVMGQICPLYSVLWFVLCGALSPLCRAARNFSANRKA